MSGTSFSGSVMSQSTFPQRRWKCFVYWSNATGAVVSKDEIWNEVWPDAFVEETNLTHNIYLLRKTLKDLGELNLIQTVPRRGYRFAGDITEVIPGDVILERHTSTKTLIEIQDGEMRKSLRSKRLGADARSAAIFVPACDFGDCCREQYC